MKGRRRQILKIVTKKITEKAAKLSLEMNSDDKQIEYKEAYLNDANGDTSRRWLIEFYVYNANTQKLQRKQVTVPSKLNKKERYAWASKQIESINELLRDGYHIKDPAPARKKKDEGPQVDPAFATMPGALKKILEIRKPNFRYRTYTSFKTPVNRFEEFCKKYNYTDLPLNDYRQKHIVQFLDYCQHTYKFGNRSRNDYKGYLVTLLNGLVSRGYLKQNPAEGIKKERYESVKSHVCFEKEEMKTLLESMPLWLRTFCLVIYYCYIRPQELRYIKVKHFDLANRQVVVPGNISKNRKALWVTIPKALLPHLQEYFAHDPDPEYYAFGKWQKPGPVPTGKGYALDKYNKYRDALQISKEKHLYSFKHTGNRDAYLAGVDIKSLQMQNRHHSLSETDKYLQELGLKKNLQIDKFPEL